VFGWYFAPQKKTNMTPERYERILEALHKRQTDITVVLENVDDLHNIAAIMRTCDAVGIQDIYIINDQPPRQRNWGFKSSGSAEKWVTAHPFTDKLQCINAVRKKYNIILTTHLSATATSLYNINFTNNSIALVFGNELKGLSEQMLNFCDGNFSIPQTGIIKSLNISVSVAVSLYEAYRQKMNAGHYNQRNLTEETIEQLKNKWRCYDMYKKAE
jgi:tRNA (guanosine-2'-O-)-methyltransferase